MNFFEHQAQARRHTRRLVLLFALAIAVMVLVIDAVVLAALAAGDERAAPWLELARAHAGALIAVALGTIGFVLIASLLRSASLRSGGAVVARALGGVPLAADAGDPIRQRLRNVIEEIAIAAGVPLPEIYVLEQEAGINAFAAGYTPADAAITVTRGAMEKLSRDELQGVIAHEYAHIVNGDMRLNLQLIGLLFGILVLALTAREVFALVARSRAGGSRNKDGNLVIAVLAATLAIWIVGSIGQFFARLIKAAVSRQRELLADASAVQFTRQTGGLAGALKKIAGLDAGSRLTAPRVEEVSHMLFGEGARASALFATHPPLVERIRRLDPQFDPAQLAQPALVWNQPGYVAADIAALAETSVTAPRVAPAEAVGATAPRDYARAVALHAALPPELRAAATSTADAWPLVFAVLLDSAAGLRALQLQQIEAAHGAAMRAAAEALAAPVRALPAGAHLALVELALPNLRRRPRAELACLMGTLDQVIRADGRVDVREFCLGCLLRVQLADALDPAQARILGRRTLDQSRAAALHVLGALAQHGHAEMRMAGAAFAAGAAPLYREPLPAYVPATDALAGLDCALRELDQLNAPGKAQLVEALVRVVAHDRKVTADEAQLLRVICAALHCPPPLSFGQTSA